MPKADVADYRDGRYALVIGPLVDESDRGKLSEEDYAFLKSMAGAIVSPTDVAFYQTFSTLAETWAESTGE